MMNSSMELNTSALDQSLPSWFAPDSKIGSIVDRLMVEEWMNITSHKAYYDRCQPITSQNDRYNEQARTTIRDNRYETALSLMPKSIGSLIVLFYWIRQYFSIPSPEWTQNGPRSNCPSLPHRLIVVYDITTDKCCKMINKPSKKIFSFDGPDILVCSINNMSTELPLESTVYFDSNL
ncbi:unnamed protein product [Rotaria sp. Silwood1]|nr:unnamed protein product [Rotaria sp. Silwood1]